MKNMFNKANTPYLVSSTLAIATLLASGVFAAAPYAGFLAPVAVLGVGLPFIIGGAVFSALVIALSDAVISKNKTISERDTQLTEKDTKISSLKGQLAKKEKVIEAKNKTIVNPNKDDELKRQHRKEKQKEILDCADLRNLLKEEKQGEILDSEALGNLFKEEKQGEILDSEALSNLFREKPKSNVVAKAEGKVNQVIKSVGAVAYVLVTLNLAARLPFTPVSRSGASTELFGQQTSLSQANDNSTINLSSTHYVPNPQVVLESKANEFEQILKSAKNNFGASQSFFPEVDNGIDTSKRQGTLFDSVELSKLTIERPVHPGLGMVY